MALPMYRKTGTGLLLQRRILDHRMAAFFPYCFAEDISAAVRGLLASAVAWALGDGAVRSDRSARSARRCLIAAWATRAFHSWTVCRLLDVALSTTLNIGHRHHSSHVSTAVCRGGSGSGMDCQQDACPMDARWRHHRSGSDRAFNFSPLPGGFQRRGDAGRCLSHLVDSSLDWGQDLPALRDWLEANSPEKGDRTRRVF